MTAGFQSYQHAATLGLLLKSEIFPKAIEFDDDDDDDDVEEEEVN